MIVCTKCGHQNADAAAFCESCHSFLEFTGEPVGSPTSGGPVPPPETGAQAAGAPPATAAPPAVSAPATQAPAADASTTAAQSGTAIARPPGLPEVARQPREVPPGPTRDVVRPQTQEPALPLAAPGGTVCPTCSTPNDPGRTFCVRCGSRLDQPAPQPPPPPPARRQIPTGTLAPIVGGLVVIAVLAAFGLSLLGGNHATTPPASQPASAGTSAGATEEASATPGATEGGSQPAGSAQPSDGGQSSSSTPTVAAASNETILFYAVRNGNPDVYVANTDGTGLKRLTHAAGADSDPAWSPDRTKIAFESHAPAAGLPGTPGQYAQVWVMNADGSDARPLTHEAATSAHAAWSPDGTKIAFDSDRGDGSALQIYVMNADGSDQHPITSIPGGASFAAWSPADPNLIAFDALATGEIWAVSADGTGSPHRLIEGKAAYPAWSADGSHIAFSTTRDGGYQIYIANADGSSLEPLTSGLAHAVSPSWSPDGGRIVFEDGVRSTSGLYIIELSSGDISPFLANQSDVHRPSWH